MFSREETNGAVELLYESGTALKMSAFTFEIFLCEAKEKEPIILLKPQTSNTEGQYIVG